MRATPSRGLVKWVGGKGRLVQQRPDVFRAARGGRVHVPFVGGGAPFFLVYAGEDAWLSDTNERLVNLYQATQRDPDAVAAACEAIADAYESWRGPVPARSEAMRAFFELQRAALDDGDGNERAGRMLFIVRWGFNGLYRENQRGDCNTAHGDGKPKRVDRAHLRACSAALRGARIFHADFAEACAHARPGDFIYLDPPFAGGFTGYAAGGTWARAPDVQTSLPGLERKTDRERLADVLSELDARGVDWTLSDAHTPETLALYLPRWSVETVHMPRSANRDPAGRGQVAELLVTNGWNR
jgi:DNA adenine methylase